MTDALLENLEFFKILLILENSIDKALNNRNL